MKPVFVDTKSCSGCGQCVAICPYGALLVQEGAAQYILEDCFLCGHCEAVCPEKAINIAGLSRPKGRFFADDDAELSSASFSDTAAILSRVMRSRRSCRNYQERVVPLEILEDLVQLGVTAPSGTNCQPWHFIILPGRDDLHLFGVHVGNFFRRLNRLAENPLARLFTTLFMGGNLERYYRNHYDSVKTALEDWDERGIDRLFHGATGGILVLAEKNASCPGEDAMLATANILLGAEALGLGTCLIGFAVEAVRRDKKIKEILGVQPDQELHAVIVLGYPKVKFLRGAGRKEVVPRVVHLKM